MRLLFFPPVLPMSELQPGADGEPLPSGEWVSRVCKKKNASKSGDIIHEGQFGPTDKEKKEDPKHRISVWAEKLTTEEQAFGFTGTDSENAVLARLNVDDVRNLRPEPDSEDIPHLQVEWHYRIVTDEAGSRIQDPSPGAKGHAGIRDLTRGNKIQRRSLRVQLAELAQKEYEVRNSGG